MRACVLHAIRDLRCEEWPLPEPGPGWARVRVAAAGICGSDIPRTYETGAKRLPMILGHELSGVVDALGPNTTGPEIGAPVAIEPMIPPADDPYVRRGLPHLCLDYDYIGSRRDGGMAEFVLAPVRNLYPLPPDMGLEAAALVEPAAVALHALRQGGLQAGMSCCFVGVGPIALLAIQWAGELGAGPILALSRDPRKLVLAESFGAEARSVLEGDTEAWVRERTEGLGAELVIEGAGVAATIGQSFHLARKRGRVVLLGNPPGDIHLPQYDYWQIVRRELVVVGTWNAEFWSEGDDWQTSIEAIASGQLSVDPLITHRISLEDTPAMVAAMRESSSDRIKVLAVP